MDSGLIEASIDQLGDATKVPADCNPWLAALTG
jgi:hypothetical protein